MTREHSGTGLGLSIVKELCKLLGGEITARKRAGQREHVHVRLPWTRADQPKLDATLNSPLEELTRPRPRRFRPRDRRLYLRAPRRRRTERRLLVPAACGQQVVRATPPISEWLGGVLRPSAAIRKLHSHTAAAIDRRSLHLATERTALHGGHSHRSRVVHRRGVQRQSRPGGWAFILRIRPRRKNSRLPAAKSSPPTTAWS